MEPDRIVFPLIHSLDNNPFNRRRVREEREEGDSNNSSGVNLPGATDTVRSRWRSCSRNRWVVGGGGGEEDGVDGDLIVMVNER